MIQGLLGFPVAYATGFAQSHFAGLAEAAASTPLRAIASQHRDGRIQAFCIDFNWTQGGVFAAPGQWADADPAAHVDWYSAAGVNTIQTFCVSCNGYAWYQGGKIPAQPGLKHNFLKEVCERGHGRGQKVMGYFCIGANSRWEKLHPEESYAPGSHQPNIVFTERYLDYLDRAITEALRLTGIDGFMIDWLWTPSGALQWLDCEKEMYRQFYGKAFPGKQKVSAEEELDFRRRSIDRCWTRIHLAAKRENPQSIVWLSCNNPSDSTIASSTPFRQVDWLMNENPDPHTWQGRGEVGRQVRLIQCVVGWGAKDDAPAILQHPSLGIKDFYGFSMPGKNSLPLPVETYLKRPIGSFEGNDKNIATVIRYFKDLPFDFLAR
ncbi:MAG TPA: hypothetical protein VGR96_08175 [Acidobacteriaceae bacterium]|nr:hypothetical protein [Acidobacteriaceae bacterium]